MAIMNFLRIFDRAVSRFSLGLKRRLVDAEFMLCGSLLLFVAAVFAAIACFLWLAQDIEPYQAALWVSGGLAIIGGAVFFAGRFRRGRAYFQGSPGSAHGFTREAEEAVKVVEQNLLSHIQRDPVTTVLTSLAVGVVLGLLRPPGRR